MIRINDKWVILVEGDRLAVAEDLHKTDDKLGVPVYSIKNTYSTLNAAINGVCSCMTIRELADNNYSLAEALQITHDLYTMVNDSIREVIGK